jgi:hypothetical protein
MRCARWIIYLLPVELIVSVYYDGAHNVSPYRVAWEISVDMKNNSANRRYLFAIWAVLFTRGHEHV